MRILFGQEWFIHYGKLSFIAEQYFDAILLFQGFFLKTKVE